MVSWQTDSLFPEETGPPLGGLLLHRLGHSKHKGLSSLSATLSSNGDSLPARESGGDKPEAAPSSGNPEAALAWGP